MSSCAIKYDKKMKEKRLLLLISLLTLIVLIILTLKGMHNDSVTDVTGMLSNVSSDNNVEILDVGTLSEDVLSLSKDVDRSEELNLSKKIENSKGELEEGRISRNIERDEHMYVIEIEPMKLKSLIKNIAEHPELSSAEKEFAISSIRYGNKCPLECLDGYSKYEKEFKERNPTGYDELSGLTFEESVNYYASYGERVRKELEEISN